MKQKRVRYNEGQWFAVPLRNGGYGIGIIVRGSYKTKGGIGYFFGPKYENIPGGYETFEKNKDNTVLICQFGDLGIINGEWPLIHDGKPFQREDWPVPLFHRVSGLFEGQVVIVDYGQDYSGDGFPLKEEMKIASDDLLKLPVDSLSGKGALEKKFTRILDLPN